ncbi:MAG: hypothetical protein HQ503_07715 [Rhodospirillales bacterium]|nr:hypothetical protein [Rhodospirillales bacterium]
MRPSSSIFVHWRQGLAQFLAWFMARRAATSYFYAKIALFFVGLNLACYWWALVTAYSEHLLGPKAIEYVLTGFPVAIFGAVFDCLSLFITLFIVRRALASTSNTNYVAFLSVDLLIAIAATFWVLLVFVVSGWIVNQILANPETFEARTVLYEGRFLEALTDPFGQQNVRNIYFGVIMGVSALLPTLFHAFLAIRAMGQSATAAITGARAD